MTTDRAIPCRCTTADEQHPLTGEHLGVEDVVVEPLPGPAVGVLERELARRERTDAARDQHGAGRICPLLGDDAERRLAVLGPAGQARHLLPQVDGRLELKRLFGHPLHEVLRQHLGEARDIEDVFLGIEGDQLPTHLVEIVDHATARAPHAGIKGAE
jgi:hypothetical protein